MYTNICWDAKTWAWWVVLSTFIAKYLNLPPPPHPKWISKQNKWPGPWEPRVQKASALAMLLWTKNALKCAKKTVILMWELRAAALLLCEDFFLSFFFFLFFCLSAQQQHPSSTPAWRWGPFFFLLLFCAAPPVTKLFPGPCKCLSTHLWNRSSLIQAQEYFKMTSLLFQMASQICIKSGLILEKLLKIHSLVWNKH